HRGRADDPLTECCRLHPREERIDIDHFSRGRVLIEGYRRVTRSPVSPIQLSVGPWNEVFPVRPIGVAAVVLPPRKLTIEPADSDRRHSLGLVVVRAAQVFRAEQPEYRTCRDRRHVAALMIEPPGVTLLRDAVADERWPWRAQRDELVGIDWDVAGVTAAEVRISGAVFHEVAGHPVVLAGAREVLHP